MPPRTGTGGEGDPFAKLVGRIREELAELRRVVIRTQTGWQRAQTAADDFYLDSVALNLHGFYSGIERLFELIAVQVDGALPEGANWHQLLLARMAEERPGIRPAVISERTQAMLDPFRGFRHVVRNVYTHILLPERLEELATRCVPLLDQLEAELLAFARFLELSKGSRSDQ